MSGLNNFDWLNIIDSINRTSLFVSGLKRARQFDSIKRLEFYLQVNQTNWFKGLSIAYNVVSNSNGILVTE